MYVVVVPVPVGIVDKCVFALQQCAKANVSWAHDSEESTPSFTDVDSHRVIDKRLPIWKVVNVDVL